MASPPTGRHSRPGPLCGAALAEGESAVGSVGLDVVHLMQASIESKLQFLRTQLFGERGGEFVRYPALVCNCHTGRSP